MLLDDRGRLLQPKSKKVLDAIRKRNRTVLLCFSSKGSESCVRAMASVPEIAAAFKNVCFVRLEAVEFDTVVKEYDVSVFPTFVLLESRAVADPGAGSSSTGPASRRKTREVFRVVGTNLQQLRIQLSNLPSSQSLVTTNAERVNRPLFAVLPSPVARKNPSLDGGNKSFADPGPSSLKSETGEDPKGDSPEGLTSEHAVDPLELKEDSRDKCRVFSLETVEELDSLQATHSSVLVFFYAQWSDQCTEQRPRLLKMLTDLWTILGVPFDPVPDCSPATGASISSSGNVIPPMVEGPHSADQGKKSKRSSGGQGSSGSTYSAVINHPELFMDVVWADVDVMSPLGVHFGPKGVPMVAVRRNGVTLKHIYEGSAKKAYAAIIRALGTPPPKK